jgi:cytochrome c-550 PedF
MFRTAKRLTALAVLWLTVPYAAAHGDVTPQAVDTRTLPQLGKELKAENPYRGHGEAIRVGASAYNQNCARCHGLEAISGGIAPDLRKMDNDCATLRVEARKKSCVAEMDKIYATSVLRASTCRPSTAS